MNILNKIHIHFFFYVVILISIFSGLFKEFLLFSSIIIIHELGHISASIYYKWNIDEIIILPFGGLVMFDDYLNKPINEELIILIMGSLFQLIYLFLVPQLAYLSIPLLLFNLIPIYPLDGYKLFYLLLSKIMSYKNSLKYALIISFITIFIFVFFIIKHFNLLFILLAILFFYRTFEEYSRRNMVCEKFYLERYLYKFIFKKRLIISGDDISKMKRDYNHMFIIKNRYHLEREILSKKFDFK